MTTAPTRAAAAAIPLALALTLTAAGCGQSITITLGSGNSVTLNGTPRESEAVPVQRFEVQGTPRVVVDNRVGKVTVRAGDGPAVEVEAVKRADTKEKLAELKLDASAEGDTVTVKWASPAADQPVTNMAIDVTVRAPKDASVKAQAGVGAVTVEGFAQGAEARSGVGSVTVRDVRGDVTLHSGNGAVGAEGVTGAVKAETGVGGVTVTGGKGPRTAHSGNGSVVIDGGDGTVSARSDVGRVELRHARGTLRASTGNGQITVTDADGALDAETGVGGLDVTGRLSGANRLKTGNGRITVALPQDSRLAVDARTGNGRITTEFGLPVEGRVSSSARGNLGDGSDGTLKIETGVGGIDLRKK